MHIYIAILQTVIILCSSEITLSAGIETASCRFLQSPSPGAQMQWDDLKIILTIARAGSLAGAARDLGVNHSTVFRRLNTFEDSLGVRLFDRLPSGYALTVAGEEMRASAEMVEREIDRLDRRITGQDLRLRGSLVVTTTDTLATGILGPHIAAFKRAYPDIDLELILDNQNVSLSKRQADVAVRPTLNPSETLVGRKICDIAFAPYWAKTLSSLHHQDLSLMPWVSVDDSLSHLASDRWFRRELPHVLIRMRTNSLQGVMMAAEAAVGAAILPCFMGDASEHLSRVGDPIEGGGSALWLLTHEDLRHTARVRAFLDFMADALRANIDLLEGRAEDLIDETEF